MKRNYKEYVDSKLRQYGSKFDTSDLAEEFIPYFESGERITINFGGDEIKRGTIGVSTGWKPIFLLMLRKDSSGSSYTIHKQDKIVNGGI